MVREFSVMATTNRVCLTQAYPTIATFYSKSLWLFESKICWSRPGVNFRAGFLKLPGFLLKPLLDRCGFIDPLLCRVSSNVFGDAHAAKVRTAHAAEVGGLGALGG